MQSVEIRVFRVLYTWLANGDAFLLNKSGFKAADQDIIPAEIRGGRERWKLAGT